MIRANFNLQKSLPQILNTIQTALPLNIYKTNPIVSTRKDQFPLGGNETDRGIDMMRKAFSVGIAGLFVVGGLIGLFALVSEDVEAPGPTEISGLISSNTTWTSDDSPYHIIGDTTLMSDYTLTIEAGTVVKFANNTELTIRGELLVNGNGSNQVVITALEPLYNYSMIYEDSMGYAGWIYYNGTGTNYKIYVDEANGGSANISYAKVEYSADWALHIDGFQDKSIIMDTTFTNNKIALAGCPSIIGRCSFKENYKAIDGGNFLLYESLFEKNIYGLGGCAGFDANNCSFKENVYGILSGNGIEIKHTTSSNNKIGVKIATEDVFLIENSIFNNTYGIILENGNPPIPTIQYNNILQNSLYNIELTYSYDIPAPNNWWGTTNTTIIGQYIYDIYDDVSLGEVTYTPFLNGPSPNAPGLPGESGLQEGAPWPMFRGNVRHTGLSPYDTSGNNGGLKWKFYTGNFITMGNIATSPVIDSKGTIYIGSEDGIFYATNSDGSEKWNFSTGGQLYTTPAIGVDGTIYISSDDNLFALYPNGTERWHYTTMNNHGSSPVIGSDGIIYIGADSKLFAFNPNGTVKWSFFIGSVSSSPAIGLDETIYVGSNDDNLYAINPNGTKKWSFLTGGDIAYCSPAIASDGTVYIGSQDNKLYAINPNGTEKWYYGAGYWVTSSPAIDSDGCVYFGSDDDKLYALYPNGTEKWIFTTSGDVWSSPAIGSDGVIYFGSEDNKLYAIDPNGTQKWKYPTGGHFRSSPAIGDDGTIYIWSYDFHLYAIGLNISNPPPANPTTPSGPTSGINNTLYSYITSTTDPDGDQIKYGWDWDGDGTVDEWSGFVDSGTEDNRSHSWSVPGVYDIKVKAQDEHGAESGWSGILVLNISNPTPPNQPPNTPSKPSGPTSGLINTSYSFSTSTTDPDGDQIQYEWDWWGIEVPYTQSEIVDSGTVNTQSHHWHTPGTYAVMVRAEDEEGDHSGWSNPLYITITLPPSANITLEMTANVTYTEPGDTILYSIFYNTSFSSGTTVVLNHQQLTLENEIQKYPSFSPDGSKIVYTSFEDGGGYRDIWTMDADGTNHQQLTFEDYYQIFPSFSPDGYKILYSSKEDGGGYLDIWIMDADGTNHQQLTFEDAGQWFPRFNPDGSKIVYNSDEDGNIDYDDIWIMDADGSNHLQLTFEDEDQFYPSFSPDGNRIVYSSKEDGGGALDIWTIKVNGSNHHQLTFEDDNQYYPSYSPDGSIIVYSSLEDYGIYNDIWTMKADGTDHQRLANEDADQLWPVFSPDGSKIAYHSKEDGDSYYDIWILNMGSEPVENTVWINVTLPSDVTFITSNAEGNRTGDYGWTFYNVGNIENVLTITVQVNEGVLNGTSLTNQADLACIYSGNYQVPSLSVTAEVIVQYFNETGEIDTDGDGTSDSEDDDDDNDGYLDTEDDFPLDPNEWLDTDGDGTGDNADSDDDNDGFVDDEDDYPLDPTRWKSETDIIISSITLSDYGPLPGELVTIYAAILNTGDDSRVVLVKFYDGNPDDGGTQIGSGQTVTIPSDGMKIIDVLWTAVEGSNTLYVVVEDTTTGEKTTAYLEVEVGENIQPILVLTTGDINVYRFEPGEERTISVEVTCYLQNVKNVRLIVLDDQNITIDHTITPPREMADGDTVKFYLRVRAPELPEGQEKLEKDILIQAVGDDGVYSNAEELDRKELWCYFKV